MPAARLPDGREVDTASPEWQAHCLAEWKALQPVVDRHVARMKLIGTTSGRRDYLAGVERADGRDMAMRVAVDFGRWFEVEKKRRQDIARRSTSTG